MSIYQRYFDELNATMKDSGTETPNWLIEIKNVADGESSSESSKSLTSSKIPNYTSFCTLLSHQFSMNRGIEKIAAEQIKPDGGLYADNLKIVTYNSCLPSDFNTHFHQNNCLNVTIVRIKSLQSESPIEDERYEFKTCYITALLVKDDFVTASFRYAHFARSVQSHKSDGGNEGSTSSSYSFVEAGKAS